MPGANHPIFWFTFPFVLVFCSFFLLPKSRERVCIAKGMIQTLGKGRFAAQDGFERLGKGLL